MSDPTPDAPAPDWQRLRELFDAALALDGAARERFLASDQVPEALRAELRSLLPHAHDEGHTFDRPATWSALLADEPPAWLDRRLGPWRVTRLLGRGGMGEVYEAQRVDGQFEGRAAIKLLKAGVDRRQVRERFALERAALARLNHPHIARLFDAGSTDDGEPYVVMEYVEGLPLDRAAQGLPLEARLALFLQLADAVAHAHRNLILHRDLKPGNVLVDAEGRVKLLDFGIAKALDPLEGAAGGVDTIAPQSRPFTPNYASPEQVRGEPASTATDVYSLGVVLYELLTGVRPTGRRATSPAEAARSVLDEQPTRPSALPAGEVPDAAWLATRRRLEGDLDQVLMKALDKSKEGRYLSVEAFAADIRAFLDGRPVSARAPSVAYLARRFVQRHRLGVGLAALGLAGIVTAAGVAAWQAHEAAQQRDLAQQRLGEIRQAANQLVFRYHDQIATLAGASAVREALLADAEAWLERLSAPAADDPGLARELAGTWYRLSNLQGGDPVINTGQFARAEANLDRALELSRRYTARNDTPVKDLAEVVNMHVSRAEMWQARGDLARAEALLAAGVPLLDEAARRGREIGRASNAMAHAQASAISLHGVHARVLANPAGAGHLGRWQAACTSADRAGAAADATAAANPGNRYLPDTLAFTATEQAQCRVMAGRFDEADGLFVRAVALRDEMATRMPEDLDFRLQRATPRGHHARLLALRGQHREAMAQLQAARGIVADALRADAANPAARRRQHALGLIAAELHIRAGRPVAAVAELQPVLQHVQAPQGRRYADLALRAEALLWLARAERARGDGRSALAAAREAESLLAVQAGADDNPARRWAWAQALTEQAAVHHAAGRADEARALAQRALPLWQPSEEGLPPLMQPLQAQTRALAGG